MLRSRCAPGLHYRDENSGSCCSILFFSTGHDIVQARDGHQTSPTKSVFEIPCNKGVQHALAQAVEQFRSSATQWLKVCTMGCPGRHPASMVPCMRFEGR